MTKNISFAYRQQMLEDRINVVSSDLDIEPDQAFMRVVYAILLNTNYDDPSYNFDVVDGSDDKQIDIINIQEKSESVTIHILQIKNSPSYKGTIVVQMRDGLNWIFKEPESKYKTIRNTDLVNKINSIRELSGRIGQKRFDVYVHYVGKGDTSRISPDFHKEVRFTTDIFKGSDIFRSFTFKVWGVNELIEQAYEIEGESVKIDADIPIYYTHSAPSFSEYRTSTIKAVLCTVDGIELASLVNKYHSRIFEENVRTYLGERKRVNTEIMNTCSNDETAANFWFFNNGITVTCTDFDVSYNASPPCIKIYNMQIVNGCQTSMTLAEAQKNGVLSQKTRVLLKVYASQDEQFIEKITIATNNQTAVTSRDLHSNDMLQRDLERLFSARGYYYERKVRKFKHLPKSEQKRVIPNEKAGQAHLAVVQHLPAVAMSQPSKIWEAYYEDIFKSRVEELLGSYLVFQYCVTKQKTKVTGTATGHEEAVLKYGTFHLARIIGHLVVHEDWRKATIKNLTKFIQTIETNPSKIDSIYVQAKNILLKIVKEIAGEEYTSLINVFKSSDIQKRIDSALRSLPSNQLD